MKQRPFDHKQDRIWSLEDLSDETWNMVKDEQIHHAPTREKFLQTRGCD